MSLNQLLAILADGQFHSGEELGQRLGVSRSAVWKQLKKLQALELDHYSVKGRGYRIPGGLNLLNTELFRQQLLPAVAAALQSIDLQLSTDSTNRQAMAAIQQGKRHGALYLAERQTAGRGRRGRVWVSPFARNLYFSLTWTFTDGAAALEGLSLAVGLAIARGLEASGLSGVRLKWPNDVLLDGHKLAGILLEVTGDAAGLCQVVIGVGVNVSMPAGAAESIDQPWTDAERVLGQALDRNRLLALIINQLLPMLEQFSKRGFAPFRDDWLCRDAFADQPICLQTQSLTIDGIERGVDDNGALLIETAQGLRAFHGGELSLRLRK